MDQINGQKNNNKRKIIKRIIKITVSLLVIAISFTAGNIVSGYGHNINTHIGLSSSQASNAEVRQFATLFEVKHELEKNYDGDIDQDKLVEGAVKGMTASLQDPYTLYMTLDEYNKYMDSNSGEFMGIGVYIESKDNKVVVTSTIPGGPAEKAGIIAGDVIYSANGETLAGDTQKAVSIITGPEKATIKLVIIRNDSQEIDLDVDRDKVKSVSVASDMVNDKVGYIALSNFDLNVSKDFTSKLQELKDKGMKGLIIDLRNNGGGYLNEAVNIASQFIPKGDTITYTIDKYNKKAVLQSVGGIEEKIPVVILTNGNTASASEVVTGALKDYNIAQSVGTTTFGKGIVQLPYELPNKDGGLKVTVSKYYTPNGNNIHKIGIAPDYEVKLTEDQAKMNPYDRNKDPQFLKALEVIQNKTN